MKKINYLTAILAVITCLSACSKKTEEKVEHVKWEYKTVLINGADISDFYYRGIVPPTEKLEELGQEGWELVDVYTLIETVHPNFGNNKYVTGIQPNTRTAQVIYTFKRPCLKGVENDKPYEVIVNGGLDLSTEDTTTEAEPAE